MYRRCLRGSFSAFLVLTLISCSSDSSHHSGTQAETDPLILDTAASFLAAATGKEYSIGVDQVVFVNTLLGFNPAEKAPLESSGAVVSAEGGSVQGCLYGDLFVLARDDYGVPLLDEQGCVMPIADPPIPVEGVDDAGNPVVTYLDTVPMLLEEYMAGSKSKCSVDPNYADYTVPVELGRLNMVRSSIQNPDMMNRAFAEAMKNINAAKSVEKDLAGRLVLVSDLLGEDGLPTGQETRSTIDSPRENLSLYRALLLYGKLVGYGVETISEEGQIVPAPWLKIRQDLNLGEFSFLRDGTVGRSTGVGQVDGYANLSASVHSRVADYEGRRIDYVQYDTATPCLYTDKNDDVFQRVFSGEENGVDETANIRGFAKHADDARRMIVFMHNVIQDVPDDGLIPSLPALEQVSNEDHLTRVVELYNATGQGFYPDQPQRHLMLEQAAAFLGAASGKGVPLSVDSVVFINTVLGLNGDLSMMDKGALYGDLWVLKRDEYGIPLKDDLGCVMPVASEPISFVIEDEFGVPRETILETVPMMPEEYMDGLFKCSVVPGYEEYVVEVEVGRLNCARNFLTNPGMLNKHLYEAVKAINTSVLVKRDLAGRLVYSTPVFDVDGNPLYDSQSGLPILVDNAIESPMENLALYRAIMKWGGLDGVTIKVKIEGVENVVTLSIADTVDLTTHGMDFLKDAESGIGHLAENGYADFSEVSHSCKADYDNVPIDFVERVPDGVCAYQDVFGANMWSRVHSSRDDVVGNIAGFVSHADDVRKNIVFIHSVIQDPLPDPL